MKKHIVFDFDDTISSAYSHNQQLFLETFLKHYPDIDQDFVRQVHYTSRGKSMDLQFLEVIKKFKLKVKLEDLVEENELLHQKLAIEVKIFDGFIDIVKHFKSLGKTISVCSNRARGSMEIILKANGLMEYLDNVVSCKDVGHEKPDPYCLNQLIDKYPGIKKEEVIYFGDSKTDAEFATNAGIDYLVIDHYLNNKQFYLVALNSFAGGEDELLVEVDKNNKEVGAIFKADAHVSPSRFHRSVSILVFNSKGQVILQKRSQFKAVDKGKWDLAGGHQTFGQTIQQTADIELKEELGIKAELEFIRTGLRQDKTQSEFFNLYYAVHDGPYKASLNEVETVQPFDCQKILDGKYDKGYEFVSYLVERVNESKPIWSKLSSK